MIRITICDGNAQTRSRLIELLDKYAAERVYAIEHTAFESAVELLHGIRGGEYDIILLDVLLPGINGMQAAHEIRHLDKSVKIIFLTSSSDFLAESYLVTAYFYVLKPIIEEALFPLLDNVFRDIEFLDETCFPVKCRTGMTRVSFARLEYAEVMNRTVFFHMIDGNTYETYGTLSDFEAKLLTRPGFIKVHRSYIVNMRHIKSLNKQTIITQSEKNVPVSRTLYRRVKDAYMCRLSVPAGQNPSDGTVKQTLHKRSISEQVFRILLVDDELDQQYYWGDLLRQKGCIVQTAGNRQDAEYLAAAEIYDCVVLDVMLGDDNGFNLCQMLKKLTGAPVIFLSSLTDSDCQLQGFMCGGVDYITKNTPADLLWAKIETRIRLSRTNEAQLYFGPLKINRSQNMVFMKEQEIHLNSTEFDLLVLLAEHPKKVYTLDEMHQAVWGATGWDDGQIVQVHMSHMRRKLERAYTDHTFIETIWGKGYRFMPPDSH